MTSPQAVLQEIERHLDNINEANAAMNGAVDYQEETAACTQLDQSRAAILNAFRVMCNLPVVPHD